MSQVYLSALAGNLASFVAGTVLTWSSPEMEKLSSNDTNVRPFDEPATDNEQSWISSIFALGAVFGPFIFGFLADKIGRKYTLLSTAPPFALCYLLLAFGKSVYLFLAARFIIGLALGGVFTVIPMYLSEIADNNNRGAMGSSMNIFLCLGLLFSYSLGPYVSVMVFNIVLTIAPCAFFVLFFLFAPETPTYYVSKDQNEEAKAVLQRLRGTGVDIQEEISGLQKKQLEDGKGSITDLFQSKGLIKALCISVGLVGFQQFSGINAVLFYAQSIFKQAGSTLAPEICSILIGSVQFGTSFITPLISDKLGRKILLLISAVGMVIAEVPLGVYCFLKDKGNDVQSISFLPIACLIVYIIMYNVGFGPLPWAVMGEIFPNNVKSIASSLTAAICWFMGFLIGYFFKSISGTIGMGPSFWIFSGCAALAIPFSWFVLIETKGKSITQIQEELNR